MEKTKLRARFHSQRAEGRVPRREGAGARERLAEHSEKDVGMHADLRGPAAPLGPEDAHRVRLVEHAARPRAGRRFPGAPPTSGPSASMLKYDSVTTQERLRLEAASARVDGGQIVVPDDDRARAG